MLNAKFLKLLSDVYGGSNMKRKTTNLFEEFILEKELNGASKHTLQAYRQAYKKMGDGTLEDMKKRLLSEGMKPSSVNTHIRYMKSFMNWCGIDGKVQFVKEQETPPHYYTKEEVVKLCKQGRTFTEQRDRLMILFMLSTGARAETLRNIKLEDLKDDGFVVFRHTKNRKPMLIPLNGNLQKEIKRYLKTWDISEYLFPAGNNKRLSGVYHTLKPYVESRGVEFRGVHAFRHTFARQFILSGGSAFSLKRILGHSSMEMTNRYVSIYGEDLRPELENIGWI